MVGGSVHTLRAVYLSINPNVKARRHGTPADCFIIKFLKHGMVGGSVDTLRGVY